MNTKPAMAYFLSHPIQYISPLLRKLAQQFDLTTYYFSDASVKGSFDKGFGKKIVWDVPLLEGYRSHFLKNYSRLETVSNRFFELINPGVLGVLRKDKADIVVINGWMYFSTIFTLVTAKLLGKQVWLRAENPLHQELRKSSKVLFLKKIVLQYLLFPMVNKFLYIGSQNKAFFLHYGAKPHQLVYTPYAVDNEKFSEQHSTLSAQKDSLKSELCIPQNAKVILFTAKYLYPKRPLDLLQAFAQLQVPDAYLVMVGEGPLRSDMEAFIKKNNLKNVKLTGFINQSEISKYYAVADVFALCSGMGETWGLSVNEAMNFALPIVVSETCGSSYDLVDNGKNGFIFKEGDVAALANGLQKILTDEDFKTSAGAVSKQKISSFTIETIVNNLYAAATAAQPNQTRNQVV